jgi:hypothetical protein
VDLMTGLLRKAGDDGWGKLATEAEERTIIVPFVQGTEELIKRRGVEVTPLVAMRAGALLTDWLIARRIEEALRKEGVCRDELRKTAKTARSADDAPAESTYSVMHPLVEALGKARERERKAIKEFEDALGGAAPPSAEGGLATELAPLLRAGDGVLEDALQFEAAKKKTTKSRSKPAATAEQLT